MAKGTYECGNCGHEVDGYSRGELLDDGWRFHDAGYKDSVRREFAMCGPCENTYAERRRLKEALNA